MKCEETCKLTFAGQNLCYFLLLFYFIINTVNVNYTLQCHIIVYFYYTLLYLIQFHIMVEKIET